MTSSAGDPAGWGVHDDDAWAAQLRAPVPAERTSPMASERARPPAEASVIVSSDVSAPRTPATTHATMEPASPIPSVSPSPPSPPSYGSSSPGPVAATPTRSAPAEPKSRASERTPPRHEDGSKKASPPPGWRRRLAWLALILAVLVTISSLIAGYFNHRRYYLVCGASEITAEQGRYFPPFGTSQLSGPEWKPISDVPADMECTSHEVKDGLALAEAFRALLFQRADAWLVGKWPDDARTRVAKIRESAGTIGAELAAVEADLTQALSLGRGADTGSREFSAMVTHRLGDVRFWQGQAELTIAITSLDRAASAFAEAVKYRPTSTRDAETWRSFVAGLANSSRQGPPLSSTAPGPGDSGSASSGSESSGTPGSTGLMPDRLPVLDPASATTDAGATEQGKPGEAPLSDTGSADGGPPAPPRPLDSSAAGPLI